jgi:hypothetical protein
MHFTAHITAPSEENNINAYLDKEHHNVHRRKTAGKKDTK